ncbi:hypothetical protein BB558_001091 [Smittium angustum]|uniref:Uncharacterized protein n=1 Tax=Smittium angustum TaxID=133377 RepID=A0A2U1JCC9_SMIAN|nr:hypothetical protein BB558_001091 [Smittium angustum]
MYSVPTAIKSLSTRINTVLPRASRCSQLLSKRSASFHPIPKNKAYLNYSKPPSTSKKNLVDLEEDLFPQTLDEFIKAEYYSQQKHYNNKKFYFYTASTAVLGYITYETYHPFEKSQAVDTPGYPLITQNKPKHIDPFDATLAQNRQPKALTTVAEKISAETPSSVEHQIEWTWSHPGLYVWGSNEHGTLDPENIGTRSFIHPWKVDFFSGSILRSASFGEKHAAAIDEYGNVFQWGERVVGGKKQHKPILSMSDKAAKKVVTSDKKTIVLTKNGKVYMLDPEKAEKKSKEILEFDPPLAKDEIPSAISAGKYHISAVTSKGRVFVAPVEKSGNKFGQLGKKSQESLGEPPNGKTWPLTLVPGIDDAIETACGNEFTLVRTASGEAYGFGSNCFGQLALGMNKTKIDKIDHPTLIPREFFQNSGKKNIPDIIGIATGGNTSYFITNSWNPVIGSPSKVEVFAAGDGSNGQMGNKMFNLVQTAPTKIQTISDIEEYDETIKDKRPVGIYNISAGNNHASEVQNEPYVHSHGSTGTKDSMFAPLMSVDSRLQAAPSKIVHTLDFYKKHGDKGRDDEVIFKRNKILTLIEFPEHDLFEEGDKTVRVEQAFVAGYNATAAFLSNKDE